MHGGLVRRPSAAALWAATAALLATPAGCARGLEGRHCFPNHTCFEGLSCLSERCVVVAPDTGPRTSADRGRADADGAESRRPKRDGGAPTDPSIPWRSRSGHGLAAFKGKLWLGGGYVGGSADNDWWTSADGRTWTMVTAGRRWSPRGGFELVEHAGKLWLLGGMAYDGTSDVWSSADGADWADAAAEAHWSPRYGHGAASFKGRLWVAGGFEFTPDRPREERPHVLGDVWSSADGKTWKLETDKPGWSARGSVAMVVFHDRLWLIGGMDGARARLDEVWSSADGKTWTKVDAGDHFGPREGHAAVVAGDAIWVLCGSRNDSHEWDDAWTSTDGTHWKKVTDLGAGWYPRKYFGAAALDRRVIIAGGWSLGLSWSNGVWMSPPPK
ncbi:MAG TPA: hypothetical protein VG389_03290 [Myxococcota bacterium]|jgi:hypothetical protein|nr:hypothetical protein [Myxococcota bacterium]